MRTESGNSSARRKTLFIALGAALAVILVVAAAVYLRQSATPEEIAAAYVEDNIDEISEEIAGLMVFQAPILSSVVEELGGEYLENLIYDVVQWDYAAEQSAANDAIYEVTATSSVSLDLDIAGLVEGSVQASLPFLMIVDMDKQAVRRASPQLADASFDADLPGLGALSAVNDALSGVDDAASAASKATDALSKITDAVPALPGGATDKVDDKSDKAVTDETAAPAEQSDSMESCVFAALEEELSGVLIEKMEETDPDTLTDEQRWEWLKVLEQVSGNYNVVNSCQALWSEPITSENADKRNDDFYDECVDNFGYLRNEDNDSNNEFRYNDPRPTRDADILELLHRPYLSLSLTDRIVLRRLFGDNEFSDYSDECVRYYPQLFLGRWVPFGSG